MSHWVEISGAYFGIRGVTLHLTIRRRFKPVWWCRKPFTHKHALRWERK